MAAPSGAERGLDPTPAWSGRKRLPACVTVLLLGAFPVVAQNGASSVEQPLAPQAYAELVRAYTEARNAYYVDYRKREQAAAKQGQSLPRSAWRPPTGAFVARAQGHARRWAGQPDAVRFLGFILTNASRERNAVAWAADQLGANHFTGNALAGVVELLPPAERLGGLAVRKLLDRIADEHADRGIRAKALLARAGMRVDTDTRGAVADLEKVLSLSADKDLVARAKDALIAARKFAIGAVAPDIVGVDTDGAALQLSDYRGKVVLLDFWGFW